MQLPASLEQERYCLLTTRSRGSGRRHVAELWFRPTEGGVHLLSSSGGLTQWCLNLQTEEQGVVRVGGRAWLARASFLHRDDPRREAALADFHRAYDPPGTDRAPAWRRDALLVHMVFVRELERETG